MSSVPHGNKSSFFPIEPKSTFEEIVNQPKIALLVEEGLAPEKTARLESIIQMLHRKFHLVVLPLKGTPKQLAERIHHEAFTLILAPAKIYIAWKSQVDTLDIQERLGRIWAGYSVDPPDWSAIWGVVTQGEARLVDFSTLQEQELILILQTLANPLLRTGLRGLLTSLPTPIYCENWQESSGLGLRLDQILSLPEMSTPPWNKRSHSIRMLLLALWNQFEKVQCHSGYFQIAVNPDLLAVRLTLKLANSNSILDALRPENGPAIYRRPSALEGLISYSHLFRLHQIQEQSEIEIMAALLGALHEDSPTDRNHLVWIDRFPSRWIAEGWNEIPNPRALHLKVLPPATLTRHGPRVPGTPPNTSRLSEFIEGFQKRYFEAQYEIRQVELKLVELAKKGASPQEIRALQAKIDSLTHRETQWIKQLSEALATRRKSTRSR